MPARMDFFSRQDRARRRTGLLVFYFCMAVACIICLVYLGVAFGLLMCGIRIVWHYPLWNPHLFAPVAAGTSLVIGGATFYKIKQLSGPWSGNCVASMLGGRLVQTNTADPGERRLLNVVEEMAIASGTPVPSVYLLNENAINAFAAGWSAPDAVVALTRAAVDVLSRDELQGVVAHEFSHIFNGDMRLNIRLIGVLHGIIFLTIMGSFLLRGSPRGGLSRFFGSFEVRSEGKGGVAALPGIFIIALVFVVVGFIGEFFARLIQMAVSRQREFLADACAVQFTRNPDGIAGALKKIGGSVTGSRMKSAYAKAVGHLFFADGIRHMFTSLMSTHPDLTIRIRQIDAHWDGFFPTVVLPAKLETGLFSGAAIPREAEGVLAAELHIAGAQRSTGSAVEADISPARVAQSVGATTAGHVAAAGELIAGLPGLYVEACREPFGARAVIFSLLIDASEQVRRMQLERLSSRGDSLVYKEVVRLIQAASVKPEHRLPLLLLALPALRSFSRFQADEFFGNLDFLIMADNTATLFEMCLRYLVLKQYRQQIGSATKGGQNRSLGAVQKDAVLLLSMLAWWGNGMEKSKADGAFSAGAARLETGAGVQPVPFNSLRPSQLESVLDALSQAAPQVKRVLIDSCASCILADQNVTVEEADLMRVVGVALDCPIPMMMTGKAE
jgi:Zn-dependent protease with chaperone function